MGYTNYTVRDGHDKRLALMLCVASSRIVHNPALRKRRCNYRDFYNLENHSWGILSTQLRKVVKVWKNYSCCYYYPARLMTNRCDRSLYELKKGCEKMLELLLLGALLADLLFARLVRYNERW